MKQTVLLLTLFLQVSVLYAQSYATVRIVDSEEGTALQRAEISNMDFAKLAYSDSFGQCLLRLPDTLTSIRVSKPGYQTQELAVGPGNVTIEMMPWVMNMEEIEIIGYHPDWAAMERAARIREMERCSLRLDLEPKEKSKKRRRSIFRWWQNWREKRGKRP